MNRVLLLGLRGSLLGLGDYSLHERPKRLRLGESGLDATVGNERSREIGQHRPTMFASHAQGRVVFIVTHLVREALDGARQLYKLPLPPGATSDSCYFKLV